MRRGAMRTSARPAATNVAGMLRAAILLGTTLVAEDAGAAWPVNGLPVCTSAGDQTSLVIAADGVGGVVLAWIDKRSDGQGDLYAQRLLPNGQIAPGWPTNGLAICTAPLAQSQPSLAAVGGGDVMIAWQDLRADADGDVYTLRVLASGALAPGWPAGGLALRATDSVQTTPALAPDGAGGAFVVWKDEEEDALGDLFLNRITPTGAVAPGWPAGGRNVCHGYSEQFQPTVISDGSGGVIVAWRDRRGGDADLYALRFGANGSVFPIWPLEGFPVCSPAIFGPHAIVPDGTGGALLAWYGHPYVSPYFLGAFAMHVTADGWPAPGWQVNGNPVGLVTEYQYSPTPVPDGQGGMVVAWGRTSPDIIACQRLTAAGSPAPGWPDAGAVVCSLNSSGAKKLAAVSDGAGGILVAWSDYPVSDQPPNIYVHRIDGNGSRPAGWPVDALRVCPGAYFQSEVVMASDGVGGAFIAWQDGRSGANWDIYAQRVGSGGVIGPVVSVSSEPRSGALRLHPPSPNPARTVVAIPFELPRHGRVGATVLDVEGRLVRTVLESREFGAGRWGVEWDGRDQSGALVPPGAYRVVVSTGVERASRLVVVLR